LEEELWSSIIKMCYNFGRGITEYFNGVMLLSEPLLSCFLAEPFSRPAPSPSEVLTRAVVPVPNPLATKLIIGAMIGAWTVPTPNTTVPRPAWSVGSIAAPSNCAPGTTTAMPKAAETPPTIKALLTLSLVESDIGIGFHSKILKIIIFSINDSNFQILTSFNNKSIFKFP
jgi:hypothetical protein